MKTHFKNTIFPEVIILFFSLMLSAMVFAADSTQVKNPTVDPAKIFILDKGYRDFQYSSSGGSSSFNTNQKKCPANFYPYVTLVPYKAPGDITGNQGVCPLRIYDDGARYKVDYQSWHYINENLQTFHLESYAVLWTVFCYPNAIARPTYDQACNIPNADYSTINQNIAQEVITVKSGIVDFNVNRFTINAPGLCPPLWNPYVVIHPQKSRQASNNIMQDYRICITRFTQSISDYTVEFSSEIDKSGSGGTDRQGIGFVWTLYCYPPGRGLPVSTYNCNR